MLKNSIKLIYKNLIPLSVGIICIYALYLRMMVLYQHTLWIDETWQLDQMRGTFFEMIRGFPKVEYGGYLSGDFYLIYPFFKIFSYNKWGLAIPHIIATILGFYLLYLICKRYFKSLWAYWITFGIVCFNATLIEHATEIRTYAVLPTLALATFYLLQKIADADFQLSLIKKVSTGVFFVLVIWFHLYGILIFGSCFLFTILSKYREKDFKTYFINAISFMGIILLFALPLWLYSLFGPHVDAYQRNINPFQFIANPFQNSLEFLKNVLGNLIGFKKLYFLLIGIIIPFCLFSKDRYKQLLFLFINIISPIAVILIIAIRGQYWFLQRQFIWTMPLFAFFLGWAWDSIFSVVRAYAQSRGTGRQE